MKLGTLSFAYIALESLYEANLPVRVSYALHKVMEPIRNELNQLESMRLKLLEKHTKEGEVDREEFLADYNELLESDTDITLPELPLKEILDSDAKISPMGLTILIQIGVLTED